MKKLIYIFGLTLLSNSMFAQVLGAVVEEVHFFDEAYEGDLDTIPAGSTTYRVFLETVHEDDVVQMIYGWEESPLFVETTTDFHVSTLGIQMELWNYQTFVELFPELEYRTYVTLAHEGPIHPEFEFMISGTVPSWDQELGFGNSIAINDSVGGGWSTDPNYTFIDLGAGEDRLYLIGQFTTTGELSGMVNAHTFIEGDNLNNVHNTGITFGTQDIAIFGCMDPAATNYNPDAEYSDNDCFYLGDLNGDGIVDTTDVLSFLGDFGCVADCSDSDFNGDGVVSTLDLLILLGQL